MDDALKIVNAIIAGRIAPLYFLMGEEPYYIDKISDYIESHLLTEDEKSFNQTVFYGRDVSAEDIISTCRRYPMMAERQVVVVKEAQDLKDIESLTSYAENPMLSTVLVICYKYKKLDARKKLHKALSKTSVSFESKKIYDNALIPWITREVARRKYNIEPKATEILAEFLGNDLSKINNELGKLEIVLPVGSTITPKLIEENIGFSKDFNVFELRKAIAYKDHKTAYLIAKNFAENHKDHPVLVTVALVFQFFSVLLQYQALKDKSSKNVFTALRLNAFQLKDYEAANRNYPMKKVSGIVATLRDIDVKSKGVGASMTPDDLMKEMLIKIFE